MVRAVGDAAEISAQLPVRLSLRSEPQPDFAVVKAKRGGYRKHPQPREVLLLIEVSDSTLRYDLGKRASLYAAHGIPEYWVFDSQRDRASRHRDPRGRRYAEVEQVESGTLPLPTLDATISLAELF